MPPQSSQAGVDWLVVNETKAGAVLRARARPGRSGRGRRRPPRRGHPARRGHRGQHGAALAGPDATDTVSAFRVDAVDTVGAGDTFVGALAVALAAGIPAAEAVRAASAAAATAATRPGARPACPARRTFLPPPESASQAG